jgi:hypothetical protein
MAAIDTIRDKWDSITPRERRMVVLLGVSTILVLIAWLTLGIRDRLDAMETHNAQMRKALNILSDYRIRGRADPASSGPEIGKDPIKLESYLDKAAQKVGIKVPAYKPRTPQPKPGGFLAHTVELNVNGLTITQVKDFLEAIESDNKLVAVTALTMKRNFNDKTQLDLKLEVSTYSNPALGPAAPGTGSGTGTAAAPAGGAK